MQYGFGVLGVSIGYFFQKLGLANIAIYQPRV